MSSHQAQEPQAVSQYFSKVPGSCGMSREHARIAAVFTPGRGWTTYPMHKRISPSWAKKMRREGVTCVALKAEGRVADFLIEELVQ